MNMPTMGQAAAFGRHVVSYSAGAITMLAGLHVISAGDATTISTSINQISSGVAQIAAGLAPLIAIGSAWYASWTASRKSQIAAVNATPGIKVVAENATAQTVTAPPKGT